MVRILLAYIQGKYSSSGTHDVSPHCNSACVKIDRTLRNNRSVVNYALTSPATFPSFVYTHSVNGGGWSASRPGPSSPGQTARLPIL
jgi:hypothetical protein